MNTDILLTTLYSHCIINNRECCCDVVVTVVDASMIVVDTTVVVVLQIILITCTCEAPVETQDMLLTGCNTVC